MVAKMLGTDAATATQSSDLMAMAVMCPPACERETASIGEYPMISKQTADALDEIAKVIKIERREVLTMLDFLETTKLPASDVLPHYGQMFKWMYEIDKNLTQT